MLVLYQVASSVVPAGLGMFFSTRVPSDKSLGYCQVSLRDTE